MYKISLLSKADLIESYDIEKNINPKPWTFKNFMSSYEIGHKGLICRENKEILGFIIFSPIQKEAHLLNIGVKKNYQKRGVGKLLMHTMITQCKAMSIRNIYLEVRVGNKNAINFYLNFNFKKDAIREGYYSGKNPEDALLMSLQI